MLTKKWYQSKTVWLNVVATILAALQFITPELLIALGLNAQKYNLILVTITSILNVVLRSSGQPTVISTEPKGTYVPEKK